MASDEMPTQHRWIDVRDCQGFLWRMYAAYEGLAVASFEGKLKSLALHKIPGASTCVTTLLTRENDDPGSDFVAVPINKATIPALKQILAAPGVLGDDGVVVHTQLATGQELIVSACDNFHDECVRVSTSVPLVLLAAMLHQGVLKLI